MSVNTLTPITRETLEHLQKRGELRHCPPDFLGLRVVDGVVVPKQPLLIEAWNYGQLANDFDQPLAKPIRAAIRELCELFSSTQ